MPSLHRGAASRLVHRRPAEKISPARGDRSPEMRPNRLVLPAPFGPTIPIVSRAPTENDRSSAMTTRPNRFVTWSTSSSGLVIRSGVRRLQVTGSRHARQQRVVNDLHFERVLGPLLPLHPDGRRDPHPRRGPLSGGQLPPPGE